MLSKCANLSCNEQFRYFGSGKLFLPDPDAVLRMSGDEMTACCHWLCEHCCKLYRIDFVNALPVLTPLPQNAPVEPLIPRPGTAA